MSQCKPQMAEPEPYGKRLRKAARLEFKRFWSLYRYWTIFATALASPILLQIARHGFRSMVNLEETLVNGLVGLLVALGGTYAIAMRKAAEVLDCQLQSEVLNQNGIITGLHAELEEFKRNPAEEYYYRLAEEEIAKWSDTCKQVVRHIYANEKLFAGPEISRFPGLDSDAVSRCLNSELRDSKIVRKKESREREIKICWEIVPAYKSAMSKLLYTDNNS